VKFYDTTAFHRVIPGFMIQGGDPNSRHGNPSTWGQGQFGQPTVPAEFTATKHVRGILSAARSNDPNSATSQFFICVATAAHLNGNYSAYGRVTSGMIVADTIVMSPRNSNDRPLQKIEMFITAIGSNDTVPVAPVLESPVDQAMVGKASTVMLKWKGVSDAILYEVEVATDYIFQNIIKTVQTGDKINYLTALQIDTTYYWHVRTNNGGHWSDWSDTRLFTTSADETGLNALINSEGPVTVFPNPSNGIFSIANLPDNSKIEIFDQDGRLIVSGSSQNKKADFDLERKTKGLYFYKVTGSDGSLQKGEILIQ
jgi:cyclophilin family peptidyl-prolyl cis-trans isomerase